VSELLVYFIRSDAPPVTEQPIVNLQAWRVIQMGNDVFLVGLTRETGKVRATSPVQSLTPDRTAVTSSGRVYHLEGPPGSAGQEGIWPHFRSPDCLDITDEVQKHFHAAQ
jgi:hypothetical protein